MAALAIMTSTLLTLAHAAGAMSPQSLPQPGTTAMTEALLSDPFLQHPTDDAVQVVWFTEFDGERHWHD